MSRADGVALLKTAPHCNPSMCPVIFRCFLGLIRYNAVQMTGKMQNKTIKRNQKSGQILIIGRFSPRPAIVTACSVVCTLAGIAGVGMSANVARAVPIYGGPSWNQTTGTGYQDFRFAIPGNSAGNGTAIAWATRPINRDERAVWWDASGTPGIELAHLGTNNRGSTTSRAYSSNAAGTIVGTAKRFSGNIDLGERSVRWSASGSAATELGNLGTDSIGATYSISLAINNAGTAVGSADRYNGNINLGNRAVRWNASSTIATELGNLGTNDSGTTFSSALAINASGISAGQASKYNGNIDVGTRAVRWDAAGTVATELGNIGTNNSGSTFSNVYAINNVGTAVGFGSKHNGDASLGSRAIRWDASSTVATELGNLGTNSAGVTSSTALAINASGTAVGNARKWSGEVHYGYGLRAVRWDASGTAATLLGDLGLNSFGHTDSQAYAINSAGTAVGYSFNYLSTATTAVSPVAWGVDGVAIDLKTLLSPTDAVNWSLGIAQGISDSNWVTGSGVFDPDGSGPMSGYHTGFLLDVISVFGTPGDATRDNVVDFSDLVILARNYNTLTGATWNTGDFTSDGAVNFNDLVLLARNYNPNGPAAVSGVGNSSFLDDWARASALVPEPTSITLISIGGVMMLLRRRA